MRAQVPVATRAAEPASAQRASGTSDAALTAVQALSAELTARGWKARVQAHTGSAPGLYVQHPDPAAIMLADCVTAAPAGDGALAYWWSWGERITWAAAVTEAADRITRVLRTADPGDGR